MNIPQGTILQDTYDFLESLTDNLEEMLVDELQEFGSQVTETKKSIRTIFKDYQEKIQDALEIATVAEATLRNEDPEYAALAQAGSAHDDINRRLEERRYYIESKFGKAEANRRIELVYNKAKVRKQIDKDEN